MKRSDSQLAELRRLFSALEADAMTEQELARLDTLLGSSAAARAHYREFIALHEDLRCMPLDALQRLGNVGADAATAELSARGHRTLRSRRVTRFAIAAVAGLAACFALIELGTGNGESTARRSAAGGDYGAESDYQAAGSASHYVASLTGASDADWASPLQTPVVGARLSKGRLELAAGTASVRFDSGATLVLKGPAAVEVTSNASATLKHGRVVFVSDGSDLHFTLSTPSSRLMHFGTEYAVLVTPDREEVHVLDGEVHRLLGAQVSGRLVAGQARVFNGNESKEIELSADLFSPTPSASAAPRGAHRRNQEDLIVVEGFDYELESRFAHDWGAGGSGWNQGWWLPPQFQQDPAIIEQASDLHHWGHYCRARGHLQACRYLASPIELDRDGLAYISYRFKIAEAPTAKASAAESTTPECILLVLRAPPFADTPYFKGGLRFLAHRSFLVLSRNHGFSRLETAIKPGVEYLWVGKIVCSADGPDQMLANLFPADEPLPDHEPSTWSIVGPEFRSDEALERLTLRLEARQGEIAIDDIMIGKSWESVTARVRDEAPVE